MYLLVKHYKKRREGVGKMWKKNESNRRIVRAWQWSE